nr:retrotransposon-related protein [Tanacetum cinerariifolium]
RIDDDNVLWQDTRLVVPNDATLREALLTEAHSSPFSFHPGSTKMYHDLKQYFWWSGMKRDVATFVARCLICQQVKIEHQRASGLLQQLDIPVWKWDEISMDFVTGLPQTQRRHDAIWVVVDRLTKSAHFLPIRKDYSVSRLTESLGNQAQVQYCFSSPDRRSERAYYSDTGGHMVNTRTDADLSTAVQNALQTLLPQIREEIREEFRTGSGSSNAGGNPPPCFLRLAGFLGAAAGTKEEHAKNFQWGLRRSTLNHLMCMSYTDVAQVANAARNYEILHERDDDDTERPDKRQRSGDRHQPTSQQSSHRSHGHHNDRQGSDRRGGNDNYRGSSSNNYSGSNNRNSGTLFIYGHAVFVLIDTGATHSVISSTFASRITTTPTLLDHVLCISTPMQDSTSTETSTEFMQRFLRLAGFLGATAGTEEEQAKNFQWGRGVVIGISQPLSRVVTGATVIITTVMDLIGVV